ncbi:MAG: hypothetical protein D6737_00425 [Chloroflexi bacterium]|nr:MAG: hypothetical protein CUN54_02905 [Phototrophicales bacterium]RMF82831.1 MAG: hypothetical protein D6737_00425 [Chloroflexota bacterium]
MSKRRRKKKRNLNLPEATLARAREMAKEDHKPDDEADDARAETTATEDDDVAVAEATAEAEEDDVASDDTVAAPVKAKPTPRRKRVSAHERTRRHAARARVDEGDIEKMARDEVKYLLAHPTKIVTEDELRREYVHVVADLRSMGILAAILVVVLIVVNLIILSS